GFWREYVRELVDEALVPTAGSSADTCGGKFGDASIQCWGIPPLCRKCSAPLAYDAFTLAWDRCQREGRTELFCTGCGDQHGARLPPPWALEVFPNLLFLVRETASDSAGAQGPRPVVFKCPTCTAPLSIDGKNRVVRCKYCESDVYLPDDLWMHFNPAA